MKVELALTCAPLQEARALEEVELKEELAMEAALAAEVIALVACEATKSAVQ